MDENMKEIVKNFNENGIGLVKGFASKDECKVMIEKMKEIINNTDMKEHIGEKFECSNARNNYFMTSGDKIRFFFDPNAYDKDGNLIDEPYKTLNKVGHALHMEPGPFQDIVTCDRTKKLLKALGYDQVSIPQSMYIFKQANVGSEVTPHQDSTFLHTSPKQTVLGMWIALEDATEDNGCLWSVPGSHKWYNNEPKVGKEDHAFMYRDGDGTSFRSGKLNEFVKTLDFQWVPHQVEAGDLVLIHDMVWHKSLPNNSNRSRNIFTWHLHNSEHQNGMKLAGYNILKGANS